MSDASRSPPPAAPPEPSSFRLVFTLGLAGLLAGVVLVGAYQLTLPAIEHHRAEAVRRAIFQVLPRCASFRTLERRGDRLEPVPEGARAAKGAARIYAGLDAGGGFLGFAVPGEEPGFQDTIKGMLGFDPGRRLIVGFQVLESRETPGLGDKIYKDAAFAANFEALAVEPAIEPVKRGGKHAPNQVETITGATISSKAVVRLLRKSVARWRPLIDRYLAAHPGLRGAGPAAAGREP